MLSLYAGKMLIFKSLDKNCTFVAYEQLIKTVTIFICDLKISFFYLICATFFWDFSSE